MAPKLTIQEWHVGIAVFAVGQSLTFDYIGYNFVLSVTSLMVQRNGEPLEVPRVSWCPARFAC